MEDALLTDAPESDRAEIERYVESYGGAIVLRVGDQLGSDAKAAMLRYRKQFGELPPHDFVWIGDGTLGSISIEDIEAAGRELREATAAREEIEREIAGLRRSLHPHFNLWWGGVMMGGGAAFALMHYAVQAWVALLVFGALFSLLGLEGLRRGR